MVLSASYLFPQRLYVLVELSVGNVVRSSSESWPSDSVRLLYKPGEIVRPDKWDPNPLIECAPGIHFFITREEAEDWP